MSRTIVLDSGPLGLVTNPGGSEEAAAWDQWLLNATIGGATVMVPEIADYEVRRELIRARWTTTRISHQFSAADEDPTASAALNAAKVLDVPSSTPAGLDSRSS